MVDLFSPILSHFAFCEIHDVPAVFISKLLIPYKKIPCKKTPFLLSLPFC